MLDGKRLPDHGRHPFKNGLVVKFDRPCLAYKFVRDGSGQPGHYIFAWYISGTVNNNGFDVIQGVEAPSLCKLLDQEGDRLWQCLTWCPYPGGSSTGRAAFHIERGQAFPREGLTVLLPDHVWPALQALAASAI